MCKSERFAIVSRILYWLILLWAKVLFERHRAMALQYFAAVNGLFHIVADNRSQSEPNVLYL